MTKLTRYQVLAIFVLLFLLVLQVPLFLAQPLTGDCILWDLEAKQVLNGGVLYRDIFQTNPPGTTWLHLLARSLFGTSSAALRLFDLFILTGIVYLMARWIIRAGAGQTSAIVAAIFLYWIHISQSVWCHCQRDNWMLFFGLVGLELRYFQLQRIKGSYRWIMARSIAEGVVWGCAFWIKPFIAIPAFLCFVVSIAIVRSWRSVADLGGVLIGGMICGAAGITWLDLT